MKPKRRRPPPNKWIPPLRDLFSRSALFTNCQKLTSKPQLCRKCHQLFEGQQLMHHSWIPPSLFCIIYSVIELDTPKQHIGKNHHFFSSCLAVSLVSFPGNVWVQRQRLFNQVSYGSYNNVKVAYKQGFWKSKMCCEKPLVRQIPWLLEKQKLSGCYYAASSQIMYYMAEICTSPKGVRIAVTQTGVFTNRPTG